MLYIYISKINENKYFWKNIFDDNMFFRVYELVFPL